MNPDSNDSFTEVKIQMCILMWNINICWCDVCRRMLVCIINDCENKRLKFQTIIRSLTINDRIRLYKQYQWNTEEIAMNVEISSDSIGVRVMVFNATFNNISAISSRSVFLVEETGVPGEKQRPAVSHWQSNTCDVGSSTEQGSTSLG